MAEQVFGITSGFYDSMNNDRLYSADQMNRPYKRVISEGIFATPQGTPSTDLQVISASNGRNVIVKAGEGLLGGRWFENVSDVVVTVSANTGIVPRRDSIIIQIDKRQSGRNANIIYREGTPASNPLPPALSTTDNVVEKRVANIYVAAGATTINNDAITDLRGSSEISWITSLIQQVDTSQLYNQWQEAYRNYYETETEAFNEFMRTLTQQLTVSTNVATFESHYTSVATVSQIPINITGFDQNRDVLMVYVNRLRATPEVDYTISLDNQYINLTTSITTGQSVNFLVLKSIVGADDEPALALLNTINNELTEITADSGWTNFVLESGVLAYSAALTPGVRKYNNQVFLRGCIKNVTAVGTIFATLPAGYRPNMTRYYTVAAASITVTIEIGTNGQLKIANIIGTVTATSLIPIDTNFIVG